MHLRGGEHAGSQAVLRIRYLNLGEQSPGLLAERVAAANHFALERLPRQLRKGQVHWLAGLHEKRILLRHGDKYFQAAEVHNVE